MAISLIVVESPTKARTISRFVGRNFVVRSSYGHIRDLPKNELGVDVEKNFAPKYIIPLKARKTVNTLKKEVEKAEVLILATDADREGEAIAWHLVQALGLNASSQPSTINHRSAEKKNQELKTERRKAKVQIARIIFHEITPQAVKEALKNPGDIDMNLVDAQQARRVLDRLVGYKLSPFLWKKISKGLSAGRVQSVAVRLIVEREREIEAFTPQEYWSITAYLCAQKGKGVGAKDTEFNAQLTHIDGKKLDKLEIKNKKEADALVEELQNASYSVKNVEQTELKKYPLPPYITSTLQRDAATRFGWSSKQTMLLAQQLYEGIELGTKGAVGLITYMRTDSLSIAEQALWQAKDTILNLYGQPYYGGLKKYKTKSKVAQEAHEAIRPTDPKRTPDSAKKYLNEKQFKLYRLIWQRFIASQMTEALFDSMTVIIAAKPSGSSPLTASYQLTASGQRMMFDGFLKVYPMKIEETVLPSLREKQLLELIKLIPEQHFTKPPARYNEASLIKTLEQYGIGRPSTYAPIISTIGERGYVYKDKGRAFHPTDTGKVVNDLLVEHFPQIVDVKFTARMEDDLDEIANGKTPWVPVIREFYQPFAKHLEQKYESVKKLIEETDELCEKCGKKLVVRYSRYGKFLGCSGFPECKNVKSLNNRSEVSIK